MPEIPEELEIKIAKRVGLLAASFPSVSIPQATLKVYAQMIADIPLEVLDTVISQCVADCKFFPSIAELREKAVLIGTAAGAHPSPPEAWGEVVRRIGSVGGYGKPEFNDSLVTRCVEIMDWRLLCTSENPVADRAHFLRIYDQLLAREIADAQLLPQSRNMRRACQETSHNFLVAKA